MKIEIDDKTLMMIFLLETCNFECEHCLRKDEPMDPRYKLSFKQFQLCLLDCRRLKSIRWVHFTGGEPTLWKENNLYLVDLLLEISRAGFIPGFTSNGSYFTNYRKCSNFFRRYLDNSTMPLKIYFSVDTFHRNFDADKGRAECLDNVIKFKDEIPASKADMLDIRVMTVISKDAASLLPDGMVQYYESRGITLGFLPLLPGEKVSSLNDLCPDLNSDNPEDLGAYRSFHVKKGQKKSNGKRENNRAEFINLIGDQYYFTDPWRKVSRLEDLTNEIVRAYE
jgi:molybdenum cofactor biosynthesis enzyme MoaA